MPLIEREHAAGCVALGQYHDRRIRQPDLQVGVLLHDLTGARDVACAKGFELIGAAGDLVQQRNLRVLPNVTHQQVVELGEHERRKQ